MSNNIEQKYGLTYDQAVVKLNKQNVYMKSAENILPDEVLRVTRDKSFVLGQYIDAINLENKILRNQNNGEDISNLLFEQKSALRIVDKNIKYL